MLIAGIIIGTVLTGLNLSATIVDQVVKAIIMA